MNKYEIVKELSSGNFGKIYKGKFNNSFYAIKEDSNYDLLNHEANIYRDLRNIKFVSKLYDFFSSENIHYMVIDCFEENLFEYKNRIFNSIDYERLLIDIFSILFKTIKDIHDMGYVHRDLKPLNICLKNGFPYIIDFGLSKKIIENNNHTHEKQIKSIIGSYSFISCNVYNNIEPSRRDDIESLIYILIFMFLKENDEKNFVGFKFDLITSRDLLNKIKIIKLDILNKILIYTKKMKFSQKPNYFYIINSIFL